MSHKIYRIKSFEIIGPYTLRIEFNDSTYKIINFESILEGELYGPLKELAFFNKVKLDLEIKTLVWPNGADFDPETLRNWAKYVSILQKRAKQWAESTI